MYVRHRGRERVVMYSTQVPSFICTQADGLAHRNKLASFFFQNDEIFIQLDELDKFGQNRPKSFKCPYIRSTDCKKSSLDFFSK